MSVFGLENLKTVNMFKASVKAVFVAAAMLLAAFAFGAAAQAAPHHAAAAKGNLLVLTINENGHDGEVVIKLRPDLAPKHIAQIKKLVADGAYNNVVFHRVMQGFMAQTGDVEYGNRNHYNDAQVGMGGSKYPNIPAEFSGAPFVRGTVGMARAANPDSANSQFFICFDDAQSLNGQYTVIGNVVKGMNVVDGIKKGDMANNGKVEGKPDYIVKAELR